MPVGLSSPFPPQPIPGGTTVLAFDARHDELVRLDARTGELLWRQALGEPVADPPLVLGNQVIQATPGGKLLVIDLPTGALRATVDLGMPLAADAGQRRVGPVSLRPGREGLPVRPHPRPARLRGGRIPRPRRRLDRLPPARLGRYLIVAENHQINESRWRVFVLDEDGAEADAGAAGPGRRLDLGHAGVVGLGDLGDRRPGRASRPTRSGPTARRTRSG